MEKKEELKKMLDELNKISGVHASAIVSRDGLIISASLPEDVDQETVAAMSATLAGTAEQVCAELKSGLFERTIIEGTEGNIISIGAGPLAILISLTSPDAKLGLVLIEMKRVADKVKKILEEK